MKAQFTWRNIAKGRWIPDDEIPALERRNAIQIVRAIEATRSAKPFWATTSVIEDAGLCIVFVRNCEGRPTPYISTYCLGVARRGENIPDWARAAIQ
jgi:hypothetical protein